MKSFIPARVRIALVLAFGIGSLALAPSACSSSSATTSATTGAGTTGASTGGACEGIVTDAGKCVAKCEDFDCLAGNVCVSNECQLVCDTHLDCQPGQHCVGAMSDYLVNDAGVPFDRADASDVVDGGNPFVPFDAGDVGDAGSHVVSVCAPSGKSANFGVACPLGTECAALFACPDGTPCDPASDAGSTCMAAECKALTCRTTGAGDAEAYCTTFDCNTDTDCPDGYDCGLIRDFHLICGKMPPKPSQNGITPCIDPSMYKANGQTYQEGPISLLRNQCIKRKPCVSCKVDLDCSEAVSADANGNLTPTQSCVMIGSELACAAACSKDLDCEADYKCTTGHCVPRFGACKGTGKFCEPCGNDLDCGGTPSNSMECGTLFGTERGCIDGSLPNTCMTTNDCPASPGGKHGVCLDTSEGVAVGDPSYHHCYFPFNVQTNKFSCW